jgi:hypothetical protein
MCEFWLARCMRAGSDQHFGVGCKHLGIPQIWLIAACFNRVCRRLSTLQDMTTFQA